ncbi:UDP-2,4-diacetamido-2,4,6-trideoxy-beta-L-altropyranose hydrolase [Bacillus sp. M6-12]|uniref:UDP-2,4-diacetamido-2,4, 6-trideoxy-beta-L-altropyranose hydrolase n=1 Tax=Bacillus sp. M6-12 TaxID=2054166 RepID=UPI000C765A95|nr:UDP-2,4-diacetamido-2,4,6-trideoxy-beta-L-altropyranose hydrolase [Bacillus sp. M6-12]PLS17891.1 UDP-2,4-diacetamido-2,4,6-trideoxy-beta-L-altropyranose hydrolase [Bacillus sp. M6-12]
MNIFIRADASIEMGTGHIMRCLTLAAFLKEKGAGVQFICASTIGNLIDYISQEGYQVLVIPESNDKLLDALNTIEALKHLKADLVIVDHYQMDWVWEAEVREAGNFKIMVIDDLADRNHDCDLLLDQNYFKAYEKRYDELMPSECKKLLGPKYLLLRPEFYQDTGTAQGISAIKNILVFYGGSDPTNETLKFLESLNFIDLSSFNVHVVVGLSNANLELIKQLCGEKNINFYVQINYISELMRKADLALGAGGVTMWERCFLGLPSIVTIVADNQKESTEAAAEFGAVWNIGWHENVQVPDLVESLNRALDRPEELKKMSIKAKQLMQSDMQYNIHPVVEAILEVLK